LFSIEISMTECYYYLNRWWGSKTARPTTQRAEYGGSSVGNGAGKWASEGGAKKLKL